MKCPNCQQNIRVVKIRRQFECEHCHAKLTSSAFVALIAMSIAWITLSIPAGNYCQGNNTCWLMLDGIIGIGAFLLVGVPVLVLTVRRHTPRTKSGT